MTEPLPVVRGTVDVLVLKALSEQPMHGFELTRWLESRTGGRLDVADAALYQALYRMEKRGLVKAEWGLTEEGRQARFYTIERAGRTHLKQQTRWWVEYAGMVTSILTAKPERG